MRRFAGLFMAACMTVAVPAATVFADEVATESVEASAETDGETNAEEQDSNAESQEESQETTDNTTQELNIAQSLDGVTLPADSEQITYTYHGNVCNAAKTATGLYLLPVVQDDSSVVWYVYNEETDKAIPYVAFTSVTTSYAIVLPNDDVTVPSGYERVDINVSGRVVPAWFKSAAGDENMYLIYAQDSDGNQGFYRFDGSNGSCLRYVADPDTDLQASADSLSAELSSLQEDYNSMSSQNSDEIEKLNNSANLHKQNYNNLKEKVEKYGMIGVAALGAVTLLMLIFFIRMISKSSKLKKANKKVTELENAAKTRAQQARPRSSQPSTRRVRSEHMGDTRMTEGREEGTSSVRRVPRNSDRGFEQSTTTSKVTRVSREESSERTQGARPVRQQLSRQAGQTASQARPARRPETAAPRAQRPARPTNAQQRPQRPTRPADSRPSGETKIFDKAPAELNDLDDVTQSTSSTQSNVAAADIDKISEQLNSLHAAESSPIENDFIEVESTTPEDIYSDDDDDDFSLTDFKDI